MAIGPTLPGRGQTIASGEELPEEFRREYWDQVKQTLRRVFQADESLADDAQRKLQELENGKQEPLTLFYHASPLEVAANLAGKTKLTPQQKIVYQGLLKGWMPDSYEGRDADLEAVRDRHLTVRHPEQ